MGVSEGKAMFRQFLTAACLLAALAGCVNGPQTHKSSATNTALTGACLVTSLPPCEISTPPDVKAQRNEAKAAATRAEAQRTANAATQDAVRRSSCLTETGPRLPLSPGQCASYGNSYSGQELQQTGRADVAQALRTLDPSITIQH
jgi:hypothetical protein